MGWKLAYGFHPLTLRPVTTTNRIEVNMLTVDLLPEGSEALEGAFVATGYYGGMMSALYALTSTGSLELYPGEGLDRIISELETAVSIANAEYPEDIEPLEAFLAFCRNYSVNA